jgi:hypothetical protein
VKASELLQGLAAGRDRHPQGWIVDRSEFLSGIRTEDAILHGVTNLKRQIGTASRLPPAVP